MVGLFVENDTWHENAEKLYYKYEKEEMYISNLVIAEAITLMKLHLDTKEIREIYYNLPYYFKILDDSKYYDEAMETFVKYNGTISFFDAMYITIMKNNQIYEIISFDKDFDNKKEIVRIFLPLNR
ncbi:MAG: PIN domain-containing protein [Methanosphaera sp.]|nr:PIN domain-containing protein [Methanosphaera sp.]